MMGKKLGIHEYVIGLTLLPLLVMAIGFGAFFLIDRSNDMDNDLLTRGRLIARQLATASEYGVFSNNLAFLDSLVAGVMQQPDVKAVVVLKDSMVLAAFGEWMGIGEPGDGGPAKADSSLKPGQWTALVRGQVTMVDTGDEVLLYQPILSSQVALDESDANTSARQMGAVVIEMSRLQTRKLKFRLLWFTVMATVAFLLVTLYLVHLASRSIIHPIRKLSEAVRAIGSGNLETRVALTSGIDELSTLTSGINRMTADLQHERTILQHRIDEATQQLRNMAFHDTLTQLPNRRLLLDRLTQTLNASKRSGRYGAAMFIDLDNFKPLNDQYGHAVGDQLLIDVARRIRCCLREMDTVARFGGDEFVVILGELSTDHAESARQAHTVAEKIQAALGETYHLLYERQGQPAKVHEHRCSSSIGVALFQNSDADEEDILRWADAAMYQAKQDGRSLIRFHGETDFPESPDRELPA